MSTCPKCRRTYADGVRFCPSDGTLIAQVVDPFLGRVLMGQFKLVAFAGRGAMGTVYRAEQVNVGRTVAVKVLRGDLLRDDSAVKRFLREAQAAARLSHPNIVNVHLVGETDEGGPFIVMEYVEGATLGALCQRLGVIETRRALRITRQIASALSEAHAQGIVHRDLKADNILLAERPRGRNAGGGADVVKVLDFGIAKLLGPRDDGPEGGAIAQLTRDGTIFGTPHYIAPEQASGHDADGRADLYSLGVILFRMVTGRLPFDGSSGMQVLMQHVREAPPRPRDIRRDIAEPVEALILTALEKRREDRFDDADSFMAAIDEVDRLVGEEAGRTLLGLSPVLSPPRAVEVARRAGVVDPGSTARVEGQGRAGRLSMTPSASASASTSTSTSARMVRTGPLVVMGGDDPATSQGGEAGLDSWASRPLPVDESDSDLYPAPAPRRALWLGLAGGAVLLIVGGVAIGRHRAAGPVATAPAPVKPPVPQSAPLVPLVEEHVASASGFAMRAGFEAAPSAGGASPMRVSIVDGKGQVVAGAVVEASVRKAGERDENVPLVAEGDHYRATVPFRGAGRHSLRVVAAAPGAPKRVTLDFDVEVPGGVATHAPTHAPVRAPVARSSSPEPARRGRHAATLGGTGPAAGDSDMPVTLIPASSSSEPVVPRALGPAPDAIPGGAAPSRPTSSRATSPVRTGRSLPSVAPVPDDSYQNLRDAK